ncbi:hypothetical protein DENSPDRAFT_868979 [Dentipellis sp. KUC8613]|nr:hypothetical protein DENSPDRAFT_868979 [Dentipellis sp. KUC8613]
MWLHDFGKEHNRLYEDMSRVREAKEDVILHPVAWSLHYRRSTAKGTSGDWMLQLSEEDPTIKQILEKEGVRVPDGSEDYEGFEGEVPERELEWWRFEAIVNPANHLTTDRESRTPASQSLEAGRGEFDSPNRDTDTKSDSLRPPLPSPPVISDTTVESNAEIAASPIRSTSSTPLQEAERPSVAADPQIPNKLESGTPAPQSNLKSLAAMLRLLESRRSAKKQSEPTTAMPAVGASSDVWTKPPGRISWPPTSVESKDENPAESTSVWSKPPGRFPWPPGSAGAENKGKKSAELYAIQKRKRTGTVSSVVETRSKAGEKSGSALVEVDKEDDASKEQEARTRPLVKRRKLVDDDVHGKESPEPSSDDEPIAVVMRATGSSHSKPVLADAKTVHVNASGSSRYPRREFTEAEQAFLDAAAEVKLVPCERCAAEHKPCIPNGAGFSCQSCRKRYKCRHVTTRRTGGRLAPSHVWEALLRNAQRPIPVLPHVPYLLPLHKADASGVDRAVLLEKLRWPKTKEEAERVLEEDMFGVELGLQARDVDVVVDLDTDEEEVPPVFGEAYEESMNTQPPTDAQHITGTPLDPRSLLRIVASLQKEVRALRLRLAEQETVCAAHTAQLAEQENVSAAHTLQLAEQETVSAAHTVRLDAQETHSTHIQESLRGRGLSLGVTGVDGAGAGWGRGMKEEVGGG